jgi:thymidylate synthase
VNDAYIDGLWWLKSAGLSEESRNGKVLVSPEPVCTTYAAPWERVLFDQQRDANPFFHLAECIWMLAGERNLGWLSQFNENMKTYSDDGWNLYGAYGHRWRKHFGFDQLDAVIGLLKKDPTTRRAVLTMWSPEHDLGTNSKDLPCNTHIYFRTVNGTLDTTVCCRSNDLVWGAYGANAVHFSFLHEFIALAAGLIPGKMHQFSNNFHIYERHWPLMNAPALDRNPYDWSTMKSLPLMGSGMREWENFLLDCESIMKGFAVRYSPFLRDVVKPMLDVYLARKAGEPGWSIMLAGLPGCDWKMAGQEWCIRRDK